MEKNLFELLKEYIENLPYANLSEAAKRSLARVNKHVANKNIGIITANRLRDESGKRTHNKVNRAQNKSLEADIRSAGFSFIRATGGWPEIQKDGSKEDVLEPSYIVVGGQDDGEKLKGFLTDRGKHYNQDAVVYKPHSDENAHLIHTSHRDADNPMGTTYSIGKYHSGKFGTIFTALHADAPSEKKRKEMTPEERKAHKWASVQIKPFIFESTRFGRPLTFEDFTFEFSEDEDLVFENKTITRKK